MILACHGISKAFEEKIIVDNGSFHIEDGSLTVEYQKKYSQVA